MGYLSGTVSVRAHVSIDDVCSELSADQVTDILKNQPEKTRNSIIAKFLLHGMDDDLYIRRAHEALLGGRASEALAYLERHLFPRMPAEEKRAA